MSPGQTADRIYQLLKTQVMNGQWRPGEHLDPTKLAMDLNASATPVRDALHQLLGERLVEAWPREGFKVPVPTEAGLRDLYAWHGDLLEMLLRGRKSGLRKSPVSALSRTRTDYSLFARIAEALGTDEYRRAIEHAGARLQGARTAEAAVFADLAQEHELLAQAWSSARLADLRPLLARYHRRREKNVTPILAQIVSARRREI